ncbi:hypothetical protein [Streptomyces sp. NPDC020880]|uniref:hypothetical protein n=1 Tax=Streptomyces sp. NPDC020880 TaxID=3365098 RepID=UPI00384F750D
MRALIEAAPSTRSDCSDRQPATRNPRPATRTGNRRTATHPRRRAAPLADTAKNSAAVRSGYYENNTSDHFPRRVTFHKVKIPLKVYELRTGKRVDQRSVQISGTSCPAVLRHEYDDTYDDGPGDQYISTDGSGIRDALRPVVTR